MARVVLFGASGHAKVVADVFRAEGKHQVVGLLAPGPAGGAPFGLPILGAEADLARLVDELRIEAGVVAIGDNWDRGGVAETVAAALPGFRFLTSVHPAAAVAPSARLGDGTVVMAGAVINPDASVGRHAIVNTSASLDHDAALGDFASLAPGATVGGNVAIGPYSAVSLGARVIHGVHIGEHTVVGAGAVVVRDLPDRVVAFGVPARVVRDRRPSDPYLRRRRAGG